MLLRQESIDSLWMTCLVHEQLNLGGILLHQNSALITGSESCHFSSSYYTFQNAVTYIFFALSSSRRHCFLHAMFYRQDVCHAPQGVRFFFCEFLKPISSCHVPLSSALGTCSVQWSVEEQQVLCQRPFFFFSFLILGVGNILHLWIVTSLLTF